MRKQSVLSVPSQAAASNQPNTRTNHSSPPLLQSPPVQLHLPWDISIETIILNQFFITRYPMIHQSARARHDTHSRKTINFALISFTFSPQLRNNNVPSTNGHAASYNIFQRFFFLILPSWREYSRSKVTSHMP